MVRASDIGSWTFCNRAWWLSNVKDVAHQNPRQLERGDQAHEQHGRTVAFAQIAQQAGLLLIAASFFMGAALILWFFFL